MTPIVSRQHKHGMLQEALPKHPVLLSTVAHLFHDLCIHNAISTEAELAKVEKSHGEEKGGAAEKRMGSTQVESSAVATPTFGATRSQGACQVAA